MSSEYPQPPYPVPIDNVGLRMYYMEEWKRKAEVELGELKGELKVLPLLVFRIQELESTNKWLVRSIVTLCMVILTAIGILVSNGA